eukprot:jgi/Tetstr1/456951/TSEL_043621.t1
MRNDAGTGVQILSYHVPGMSAFLPSVDHEDEARRRKHETARTMAAAKEMRHSYLEAHIGDDEYILADVKATVAEATAGKNDEQEMRRLALRGEGQTPVLTGRCVELGNWQPHMAVELTGTEADTWQLERGTNAPRPGQRGANAPRPGHVSVSCNPVY